MFRREFLKCLLTVWASAALAWSSPATAEEAPWKAGLARAKITPDKPLWLAGYAARDRPAEGTLHDLWVKVLALEDAGGRRAVLVTADVLGFPKNMYDRMCDELGRRCGLDRSQLMFNSSHTHSGPVLRDALYDIYPLDDQQRALIEAYSAALEKTVVSTIAEALGRLEPATLSAGEGKAGFAANRRAGRQKQPDAGVPKSPVDHSVPVLAVRSQEGRLRAVVFGYACHCTTLSIYQWSGDYAGFAQIALEEDHDGTQAMFFAGCGADQNPMPRRTVELCRQHGHQLADAVEEVLDRPLRPISSRLQTAFEFVTLDFHEQPNAEDLEKLVAGGGYRGRWAERMLKLLESGRPLQKDYRYPVQAWKLGVDQLWISLGGEVVVDYPLTLKAKYGPTTWVAGYTNDVMAYIPSRRVWEEGGYEAGAFSVYGLPAVRWTPDIETRIAESVDRLVRRLDATERVPD